MIGDQLRAKMILFGHPSCINSAKCLQIAAEKGVDVDSRILDLNNLESNAAFIEVSPLKIVPALRHVDFMIYGTLAIMSYLDDKGFGLSLVPRNGVVRAQMYQWISTAMEHQNKIAQDDMASIAPVLDQLDEQIGSNRKGNFICGDFSMADVHWSACVNICGIKGHGDQVNSRSNLKKWFENVKQHPSTSKEKTIPFNAVPTADDIQNNKMRDVSINV